MPRDDPDRPLPSGAVTFLLTDIQGSTRLWEHHPADMAAALRRHDAIIDEGVASHGGLVLKQRGEGDSVFAVFADAGAALAAACAIQRTLTTEPWPEATSLAVRMALHRGEAAPSGRDYYGPTVNRAARLRAICHGGQVICSDAVAQATGGSLPDGATLRPLGMHRLKDLTQPERIHQLCHPELRDEFPVLASVDARPDNLAGYLTSFVGREHELEALGNLLSGSHRLVTLTGPGGVGKTRLAIRAATDAGPANPDGVWLVELAQVADPASVTQALATTLGLRETKDSSVFQAITSYLAPLNAMVVLDNCEHVIDTAAELALHLARACPEVTVLATSREALSVPGEVIFEVAPLGLPPANPHRVEDLEQSPATRLFVDRARMARPSYSPDAEASAAIAEVCRALDGIPLAIELAASHVQRGGTAALHALLRGRLRIRGPARGQVPRHQTLGAALDWSYELLAEDERRVFRHVGVFSGGFTVDALAAVLGESAMHDLHHLVAALASKSLVAPRDDGEHQRFAVLETVRAYASQQLVQRGELEEARAGHTAFFAGLAERHGSHRDPRGQDDAFRALDEDHANIVQAILAAGDAGRPDDALTICWHLRHYLFVRGRWTEAVSLIERSLDRAGVSTERRSYAEQQLAELAHYRGENTRARELATLALAGFDARADAMGSGAAHNILGNVELHAGEIDKAVEHLRASIQAYASHGDARGVAVATGNLGLIHLDTGELDAAAASFQAALAMRRKLGDRRGEGLALYNLGVAAWQRGDLDEATTLLDRSLRIGHEVGDRRIVAAATMELAQIAPHGVDVPALEEALRLARASGDLGLAADVLLRQARTALEAGDHHGALGVIRDEASTLRQVGHRRMIAEAFRVLAAVAADNGHWDEATRYLGAAEGWWPRSYHAGVASKDRDVFERARSETGVGFEEAFRLARDGHVAELNTLVARFGAESG